MHATVKSLFASMMWKFSERFLVQAVSFIVSLILARILMPSDYGMVALVEIFVSLADVFVVSGFSSALIQKDNPVKNDYDTLFICSMVLAIAIYIVIYFMAPIISMFFSAENLDIIMRVVALRLPIAAINSIQVAYISKRMQFKKLFYTSSIGTVVSAIIGVYMALNGCGVWSLVGQNLSSACVTSVMLWRLSGWIPRMSFSLEVAKPLVRFGWKVLVADLIGQMFNQLYAFIIGKKYTATDLAFFNRGNNFINLIANNITNVVVSVMFPAFSNMNGDLDSIKRLNYKILSVLVFVVSPLMVMLFVMADDIIKILLTEKWLMAVPFLQLAACAEMVSLPSTLSLQIIKAVGRSDILLIIEFIKKPICLLVVILSIPYGVMALGVSMVINSLFTSLVNIYAYAKTTKGNFIDNIIKGYLQLLPSLIMGVILWYIKGEIHFTSSVNIVLGGGGGLVAYLIISYVLRNAGFRNVREFFR